MIEVPDALRLAHLLDIDKWPDAAAELRRLYARVQELESIERQLCEQADVAANAYRELESEAANNARILGASAETELALRGRIAEMEKQMVAIGAGGVDPLRKRAEAAPQAVQAAVPEAIEQMAADRYKVVPSHESMFHRWAVVADNGAQQLYIGREGECQNMARKFMGAFLDGAFVAMQNAAAPQIDWESAAEKIAIEVADNCGTVPALTHPHIYLGLKELFTSHPTEHGLEQFIEQVGDVHFQRCRVGSKEGAIRWDIEFGHYGAEVCGKTLREAITKAIAAQAKKGGTQQ